MKKVVVIIGAILIALSGCALQEPVSGDVSIARGIDSIPTFEEFKASFVPAILLKEKDYYLLGGDIILIPHPQIDGHRIEILTNPQKAYEYKYGEQKANTSGFEILDDTIILWSWYRYAWPNGQIDYKYTSTFSPAEKSIIREAMNEWEKVLNVNFSENINNVQGLSIRREELTYGAANATTGYSPAQIEIFGNVLNVGSHVKINPDGNLGEVKFDKGIFIHELGHVLGLKHEHQRPDASLYVQYNTAITSTNVKAEGNLKPYTDVEIGEHYKTTQYDFDSIMHYPGNLFTWINPNFGFSLTNLGQRDHISELDIYTLGRLYGIKKLPIKLVTPNVNQILHDKNVVISWKPIAQDYGLSSYKIDIYNADNNLLVKSIDTSLTSLEVNNLFSGNYFIVISSIIRGIRIYSDSFYFSLDFPEIHKIKVGGTINTGSVNSVPLRWKKMTSPNVYDEDVLYMYTGYFWGIYGCGDSNPVIFANQNSSQPDYIIPGTFFVLTGDETSGPVTKRFSFYNKNNQLIGTNILTVNNINKIIYTPGDKPEDYAVFYFDGEKVEVNNSYVAKVTIGGYTKYGSDSGLIFYTTDIFNRLVKPVLSDGCPKTGYNNYNQSTWYNLLTFSGEDYILPGETFALKGSGYSAGLIGKTFGFYDQFGKSLGYFWVEIPTHDVLYQNSGAGFVEFEFNGTNVYMIENGTLQKYPRYISKIEVIGEAATSGTSDESTLSWYLVNTSSIINYDPVFNVKSGPNFYQAQDDNPLTFTGGEFKIGNTIQLLGNANSSPHHKKINFYDQDNILVSSITHNLNNSQDLLRKYYIGQYVSPIDSAFIKYHFDGTNVIVK